MTRLISWWNELSLGEFWLLFGGLSLAIAVTIFLIWKISARPRPASPAGGTSTGRGWSWPSLATLGKIWWVIWRVGVVLAFIALFAMWIVSIVNKDEVEARAQQLANQSIAEHLVTTKQNRSGQWKFKWQLPEGQTSQGRNSRVLDVEITLDDEKSFHVVLHDKNPRHVDERVGGLRLSRVGAGPKDSLDLIGSGSNYLDGDGGPVTLHKQRNGLGWSGNWILKGGSTVYIELWQE